MRTVITPKDSAKNNFPKCQTVRAELVEAWTVWRGGSRIFPCILRQAQDERKNPYQAK